MTELQTYPWDASDYLETQDDIMAYLDAALEDGDPNLITAALGDVVRSKGMANICLTHVQANSDELDTQWL